MVQIYGSGLKGYANTAVVNDEGHLWIAGSISSMPPVTVITQLVQRIDYEDEMQPIYMGLALPGTNIGSASWQIRRNTFSGVSPKLIVAVLFGSGNTNFDKVWSNRSGTDAEYS